MLVVDKGWTLQPGQSLVLTTAAGLQGAAAAAAGAVQQQPQRLQVDCRKSDTGNFLRARWGRLSYAAQCSTPASVQRSKLQLNMTSRFAIGFCVLLWSGAGFVPSKKLLVPCHNALSCSCMHLPVISEVRGYQLCRRRQTQSSARQQLAALHLSNFTMPAAIGVLQVWSCWEYPCSTALGLPWCCWEGAPSNCRWVGGCMKGAGDRDEQPAALISRKKVCRQCVYRSHSHGCA